MEAAALEAAGLLDVLDLASLSEAELSAITGAGCSAAIRGLRAAGQALVESECAAPLVGSIATRVVFVAARRRGVQRARMTPQCAAQIAVDDMFIH